ncbi:MAG: restriction endonuclease [Salegentibacter sp.]
MESTNLKIVKASGEKISFSMDKIAASLRRSGAKEEVIKPILNTLATELYDGISTKEIYNRAYRLLKKKNSTTASRYKLKKAIYELGPTGFPFEKFVAAILQYSGYEVETGKIVDGACVTHEIDVIAGKSPEKLLIECKFHNEQGRNCDVKIPLYIDSRFRDIREFYRSKKMAEEYFNEGWVVTNTRFTTDALRYGKCAGLFLLSWDLPKGNSLKDRIDRLGLYPITVSDLMTQREKQFLLSRDVVLCRQLLHDKFYLDHLDVSEHRKKKILQEMEKICQKSKHIPV